MYDTVVLSFCNTYLIFSVAGHCATRFHWLLVSVIFGFNQTSDDREYIPVLIFSNKCSRSHSSSSRSQSRTNFLNSGESEILLLKKRKPNASCVSCKVSKYIFVSL